MTIVIPGSETPNVDQYLHGWLEHERHFGSVANSPVPLYRYLLENGERFRGVKWTNWRGRGYRMGIERRCFENAQKLALDFNLRYVEGWAFRGLLSVHHGWCISEDGRVIDPTWRERKTDVPVDEWEYLGISFGPYEILELASTEQHSLLYTEAFLKRVPEMKFKKRVIV